MDKKYDCYGFGLRRRNWIVNPNPKSDFEYGLSITILSTKLNCIKQSNPAIPCKQLGLDNFLEAKYIIT
jgi:hypothetical protein